MSKKNKNAVDNKTKVNKMPSVEEGLLNKSPFFPTDQLLNESTKLTPDDVDFSDRSESINTDDDQPENYYQMDYGDVRMLNATTLFFDGYVEKYTINRALDQLKRINKNINAMEHDYPSLKGTLTPTVIINSNGGSVIEGLRFHDAIKSNKYPVTTIVSGIAASMGIIISSAGAVKKATKNSVLMIHSISAGAHGKYSQLMDYAKFQTQLQETLSQILKDNTGAKKEAIDTFMKGESYIMAKDALELKLIDEIVDSF